MLFLQCQGISKPLGKITFSSAKTVCKCFSFTRLEKEWKKNRIILFKKNNRNKKMHG
jgi:hypothetical protein